MPVLTEILDGNIALVTMSGKSATQSFSMEFLPEIAAAIDSVDGVTYFLTAAHFCEVQEALDISQQMFQGYTGYRFEIINCL